MNIKVCPREFVNQEIDQCLNREHIKVISITDPRSNPASIGLPESRILRLQFHDLRTEQIDVVKSINKDKSDWPILFDESHANQINDFINEDDEIVIIHCEAGISRSPAVAAALALKFISKKECESFFIKYFPNNHVFAILCRILLINSFEEIIGNHQNKDVENFFEENDE